MEGTKYEADLTREEIVAFLADIGERLVDSDTACMQSLVALNYLLRRSDAVRLFDDEIRAELRDLWKKVTSWGLHLDEPPLLFGLPKDFEISDTDVSSEVEDDDKVLEVKMLPQQSKVNSEKKEGSQGRRTPRSDEDEDDEDSDVDGDEDDDDSEEGEEGDFDYEE